MTEDFADVISQVSEKAVKRLNTALGKIGAGQYGPNEWFGDVVGFWVSDVFGTTAASGSGVTLLLVTKNNRRSREVSAVDLAKVVLTNLKRLGGGPVKEISASNGFLLVTPESALPTSPGKVAVEALPALDTYVTTGEHYLGLLYEDQAVLAQVLFIAE